MRTWGDSHRAATEGCDWFKKPLSVRHKTHHVAGRDIICEGPADVPGRGIEELCTATAQPPRSPEPGRAVSKAPSGSHREPPPPIASGRDPSCPHEISKCLGLVLRTLPRTTEGRFYSFGCVRTRLLFVRRHKVCDDHTPLTRMTRHCHTRRFQRPGASTTAQKDRNEGCGGPGAAPRTPNVAWWPRNWGTRSAQCKNGAKGKVDLGPRWNHDQRRTHPSRRSCMLHCAQWLYGQVGRESTACEGRY